MKRRKRAFILIEVLISSILFAMLLSVMFGIFWRCTKINEAITKQRKTYEALLIAQTRLQTVFSNSVFKKTKDNPPYFYIEETAGGPALVFLFENEAEVDGDFLVLLGAKLYIDAKERLCLATWRHQTALKDPPKQVRKEVLLDHISSLEIELFASSTSKKESQKQKSSEDVPECRWLSQWPREYERRPALIKLTCRSTKNRNRPFLFWFVIPREIQTIHYRKN